MLIPRVEEVLHQQLLDIISDLNGDQEAWDFVGVGRDDGHEAGEYSPILYRPDVWDLKVEKTVWLSKTPDRPSKSWDASSTRILTIAVFLHHSSRKTLVAMNTHLDDQGSKSRLEAAKIILEQIHLLTHQVPHTKRHPVFLAGDFNSEPTQEAYEEMTRHHSPMVDLLTLVPESQRYGDENTFSGFDPGTTRRKRIDFIFLSKGDFNGVMRGDDRKKNQDPWAANGYAVLPNKFEDGVYNSDHQAVCGDVSIV